MSGARQQNLPDLWFAAAMDIYSKGQKSYGADASAARNKVYETYRRAFMAVAAKAHEVSPNGDKALPLDSPAAGSAVKAALAKAPSEQPFRNAVQAAFDGLKDRYAMLSMGNAQNALGVLKRTLPEDRLALVA